MNGLSAAKGKLTEIFNEFAQLWQGWGIDAQPVAVGL